MDKIEIQEEIDLDQSPNEQLIIENFESHSEKESQSGFWEKWSSLPFCIKCILVLLVNPISCLITVFIVLVAFVFLLLQLPTCSIFQNLMYLFSWMMCWFDWNCVQTHFYCGNGIRWIANVFQFLFISFLNISIFIILCISVWFLLIGIGVLLYCTYCWVETMLFNQESSLQ